MFALIQIEKHASNKGSTAGRYQFDTHPTGIGLSVFMKLKKQSSSSCQIVFQSFILHVNVKFAF